MKELMVTLLLLTWTGMVVAQDNNDSGFQPKSGASDARPFGGGEAPMVPIVSGDDSSRTGGDFGQRNDRQNSRARSAFPTQGRTQPTSGTNSMLDSQKTVRDSFPTRTTESANPASRFNSGIVDKALAPKQPIAYLGLPAKAISDLQKYGSVKAPVESRFIDQIRISDRNVPKVGPIRHITPELRGDTLVFKFDAKELSEIAEYSYEFDVPPSLKGRYRSATIEYPPALDRLANRAPESQATGNPTFQSDDSRWRLAGATDPRDPVRTDSFQNDQRNAAAEYQRELDRQREQWTRDKEAAEKAELAQKAKWYENEVARMRLEQQRQQVQQPLATQPQPNLYPQHPRYADQRYQAGQTPIPVVPAGSYTPFPQPVNPVYPTVDPNASATAAYLQIQNQRMKQMEDRVAQMSSENQFLKSEMRNVNSGNRESVNKRFDYRDDLTRNDSTIQRRRTEAEAPAMNRPLMAMGGNKRSGNDDVNRAGAGAGEPETKRSSTWSNEMLLLWLMLLCSVGLNLYLWAISRGFYSRYQELADELRETFTATV